MDFYNSAQKMLVHDEGMKLKPYADTHGNITIGVGRNLSAKGLSIEEVSVLLKNDIEQATKGAKRVVGEEFFNSLTDVRKLALINLVFNLGEGGFATFTGTISLMHAGKWELVASHLLATPYGSQVGDRAKRVALMLERDEFPY